MVFGCTSSPGIYDRVAKLVINLAATKAGTDKKAILQCLDDVVGFGPPEDSSCQEFYDSYRETCGRVGVILAPEGDKDKAFPPTTEGTILGVEYDSETFMWRIPEQKAAYICQTLYKIMDGESVTNEEVLTMMGRINHYFPLIVGAKFERHWLSEMGDALKPKYWTVRPSRLARDQARWWAWALLANQSWARIPDIRNFFPANVVNLYPDAAGGSDTDIRRGLGGCIWLEDTRRPWVYLLWSKAIRSGRRNNLGHKFNAKLTMLEGVAALALMCAEPVLLKGKNVKIWTDNAGLVYAFKKGNSTCTYAATVVKAMDAVAKALNITLIVVKTPRVSGAGEYVADALSKGKITDALSELPEHRDGPSEIPRTLVRLSSTGID